MFTQKIDEDTVLQALRQSLQFEVFDGRFNPTAERLKTIAESGAKLLEQATDSQLGLFSE